MRIIIKWLPQAITLLDNIYRFYSEKARPQLSVYTTDYWILPNLYAFFRKRALSNRY